MQVQGKTGMNDKVNSITIHELKQPQMQVNFIDKNDGTFTIKIVDQAFGGNNRLPMLTALMKNEDALAGIIKNELIAGGSPGHFSKFDVSLFGERGGSATHGGEIRGGGNVKLGEVSAGVNGESTTNGKLASGIQFDYTPSHAGPSRERQAQLQEILKDHVDRFCLDWAINNPTGANNIRPDNSISLKVTSQAVSNYVADELGFPRPPINPADPEKSRDYHVKFIQEMIRKAGGMMSDNDIGGAAPGQVISGLDSPSHPHHKMYADLAGKLGEMTTQQRNGQTPETLAAALTLSAANAKFDPVKSVEIMPGKFENTLFAVQGDPSSPASKSAMIDTANPKIPTADQLEQMKSQQSAPQQQIAALERAGLSRA